MPADTRSAASAPTRWTLLRRAERVVLYRDGVLAGRVEGDAAALELLAAQIRIHVAEHAPDRAFVHAGAVAWRGRAILIPGRSFTGKSTLVAALLRAGASYLSDEYAVLDADGLVHPFEKPISLRLDGGFIQTDHELATFTVLPPQREPVPVAAIVVAPFEEDATWQPQETSSGAGAMALIANAVAIRRDPERVMAYLRRAVDGAVVFEGERGEADEAAADLLARLDAGTRRPTHA